MLHIILGLFFIALGIWGVYDEWYYVVDFIKGFFSIFLVLFGLVGIMAGIVGSKGKILSAGASQTIDDAIDFEKED